ncbi:MAG TPA: ribonuclease P protein component [Desulfobacteraceae bacterium]|nr:ribonuclease P protein component [Deltaproteobacteria bacterium]MBW2356431.1 ribonuclease P protein component [Deltaproteobacteria bacterium]HDI58927.1 ribonuclease P protein component [Desulfobacteraceae bacterium]
MTPLKDTRFGFPRAHRLLKRRDFLRLSRTGRRVQDAHFILCFTPGQSATARLGITVSRRVGGAVVRNRIKRLCREFFRLQGHRIAGGRDLLLIAKKQAAASDNETLRRSLGCLFRTLKG